MHHSIKIIVTFYIGVGEDCFKVRTFWFDCSIEVLCSIVTFCYQIVKEYTMVIIRGIMKLT